MANIRDIAEPEHCAKRMIDALAHRGPDAEGIWRDGDEVILGHRRLSIIDLSMAADQPFHTADGRYVIVYNGELYNFRELRNELRNAPEAVVFRTESDTEVVAAAYARWGAACVERFNGMFAFAVWDREKKELFIARDRLGVKPLYFFHHQGRLLFASELRALLATGHVPRKVDEAALSDYIRYQVVHAPATMVKGIRMIMPGHWLRYKAGIIEEHRWWSPVERADRSAAELSIHDVRAGIRDRLTRAVERRLVSDVPFGAFLSGGIDSSAIVGLMAEVSADPVHTFSIGFDEAEFNEEHYARLVAKKFRTIHTPVFLRPDELLGSIPGILAAMDHPSGDGPNVYMVSQATKQAGITMALSGLGSDEIFAGYWVFARLMKYRRYGPLAAMPPLVRRAVAALAVRLKYPEDYHVLTHAMQLGSVEVDRTYPKVRQVAPDHELRKLLASHTLAPDEQERIAHDLLIEQRGGDLPVLSRISLLEISTYMQNQLLRDTDQMSMAHALEVRVPFLDHELVEFVLGVSDKHKMSRTAPKELLVTALGDLLPPEVVHRPKMGFVLPWAEWMRKDLRTFCEERIQRLGQRNAFDKEALNDLWEKFLHAPKAISWARLWYLVVLEDWLERNGMET